jgi:nucleoside 2-deoxyribosyltransferase
MKIYVAGASSEIERAEAMIVRLRAAGIEVTCTWTENIRKVGHGNPADASHDQRRKRSEQDLVEVARAQILWFLLPRPPNATFGAWVELGFAFARGKRILLSGQHNNIFVGLGNMFADDEEAFKAIIGAHQVGAFENIETLY